MSDTFSHSIIKRILQGLIPLKWDPPAFKINHFQKKKKVHISFSSNKQFSPIAL